MLKFIIVTQVLLSSMALFADMQSASGAELPKSKAEAEAEFPRLPSLLLGPQETFIVKRDILRCIDSINNLVKNLKFNFSDFDVEIVDRSPKEFWAILIDLERGPDPLGSYRGFFEMTIRKEDCSVTRYGFSR